mgnify:CR=1 FL=1
MNRSSVFRSSVIEHHVAAAECWYRVLGVVNDPAYETTDLGEAGSDVLKTWERMDEGDLEFDEGLREAAQSESQGGQKEKEAGEADPAF